MSRALFLTAGLGVGFMVCQGFAWERLLHIHLLPGLRHYALTFYMLTGLHAIHVVGGLLLMGWVIVQAHRGRYWSYHHPGILYNTMYWHFLGVAWVLLFGVLVVGS